MVLVLLVACGKSGHPSSSGTGAGGHGGSGGTAGSAGHAGGGRGGSAGSGTGGSSSGRGGDAGDGVGATGGSGGSGAAGGGGRAGGGGGAGRGGSAGKAGGGSGGGGAGQGLTGGMGEAGAGGAVDLGPLAPLIEAFCATARACCAMGGQPVGALDQCEASFVAQSGNAAVVAAGKVTLNQTALDACVAAFDSAASSCVTNGIVAACHGILVGSVADDGACSDVAECDRSQGPKVCQKFIDSGDLGTCRTPPRGTSGDPCSMSCPDGGNCSVTSVSPDASYPTTLCYESDGLFCHSGYSCEPLVAEGDSCSDSSACGSDAYCAGDQCAARLMPGDACSFGPDCGQGYACDNGHCVPAPFASSYVCVGYPPYFD